MSDVLVYVSPELDAKMRDPATAPSGVSIVECNRTIDGVFYPLMAIEVDAAAEVPQ